ncbi:MAG TPA: LPS export ABC transporter permease LptF [Caulobacteraceae bacterium]|jgi:lipopolysaccharide export system permease protein|nr:LPS export ABC transporter permease LptF [Caulobacteraceae bacterium]
MSLIERYLLRQLLGPTVLATLALGGVGLLSQSLGALDIIVNQGQSALVLIKITLLGMPQLMVMILPIAIFVATLVALNRLHTEQEIVVCFASGMSRWRVIAPAIYLAVGATLITLFINLWIEPLAERALRDELFRVRTDLAASLVRVGEFNQAAHGLTVYAQSSDQSGGLHNLFILQEKPDGGDTTFLANRGKVTTRNGAPVLIMWDGSNQEFSPTGVLNYLKFGEYIFDLKSFLSTDELINYKISDRYLHELLFPDLQQSWERRNRVKMIAEANNRLSEPLYNITFMAMALAAVIGGPFSRLGYGRQILLVGAAAGVVRILGFGAQAACESNIAFNLVQYALPVGAAVWAFHQLFRQPVARAVDLMPLTGSTLRTAGAEA